jgi:hypothetical protein
MKSSFGKKIGDKFEDINIYYINNLKYCMWINLISGIISQWSTKWLQRSNVHMITMLYVSKDELNVLQIAK